MTRLKSIALPGDVRHCARHGQSSPIVKPTGSGLPLDWWGHQPWEIGPMIPRPARNYDLPTRPVFGWALALAMLSVPALAATPHEGPFPRLILRGVTVVDGTGAPPWGPVDLVIEGDRIVDLVSVGPPGLAIDPDRRPALGAGGRELELEGAWVLPGLIDTWTYPGAHPEYAFELLLAHGVTTVREAVCERGVAACLEVAAASEEHRMAAPRVIPWLTSWVGAPGPVDDAAAAREWVAAAAEAGARGVRLRGSRPEVLLAALDEAERRGLATSAHHEPGLTTRTDALVTARHGLDILEHWYGLPEALLPEGALQDWPVDYNHSEEQERFRAAGRLWESAPGPGSERWQAVVGELIERGVALLPTLSLYEANRDLMRSRRAEWHDAYTLPSLWRSFEPDRRRHGAHFYSWTSEDEVAWGRNYRRWMQFLADYKDRGGRVLVGSDAGYMYSLYGFATVREMELLREAGFHPLEVVRAATLWGAEALGIGAETGSIERGKRADLLVVEANPIADLKVLYGTGALRLGDDGTLARVGGVRWTIQGGALYDGEALRAELRAEVAAAKAAEATAAEPRSP